MTKSHADAHSFYREMLRALDAQHVPYLIGGAYAMAAYAGVYRDTKDLDIFCLPKDAPRIIGLGAEAGYESKLLAPHWLGKIKYLDHFIDVIFSSGNGLCEVDRSWFDNAEPGILFGRPVKLVPAEEMIWSKAFIMERHRYDGGDIIHLLRAKALTIDWPRLAGRFAEHWRVLLAHLVLYGYVYPDRRGDIPADLLEAWADKLKSDLEGGETGLCRGTFLSIFDYWVDVDQWGCRDARLPPTGRLSPKDIEQFGRPWA